LTHKTSFTKTIDFGETEMAQMSGRLVISPQGISTLKGIRLAIQGAKRPLTDATNFIIGSGINLSFPIIVTGGDGSLGNIPVFFITNVAAAVPQPANTFDFEIADELTQRNATVETLQRKQRERQIFIGITGGAVLVAVIALLILSRRNSDNS
jgi:hypothetical protein